MTGYSVLGLHCNSGTCGVLLGDAFAVDLSCVECDTMGFLVPLVSFAVHDEGSNNFYVDLVSVG